jgi:hypothetical protein
VNMRGRSSYGHRKTGLIVIQGHKQKIPKSAHAVDIPHRSVDRASLTHSITTGYAAIGAHPDVLEAGNLCNTHLTRGTGR